MTDNIRPSAQKKSTAEPSDFCAEQVRRHDYDLYVTTLFSPRAERPALWALYALRIELARIKYNVTEKMMGLIRFQWWRDAVQQLFQGQVLRHDVLQALGEARQHIPHWKENAFQELIDAYEADFLALETISLEEYWRHVERLSFPLMHLACSISTPPPEKETRIIARCYEMSQRILAIPHLLATGGKMLLPLEIYHALGHSTHGMGRQEIERKLQPVIKEITLQGNREMISINRRTMKAHKPLLAGFVARKNFRQIEKYDYALFSAAENNNGNFLPMYIFMKRLFL